jgi:chemotaxis signal transduction protein
MIATAKIMDIATEGTFADSASGENRPLLQIFRRGNARFALLTDEIAAIAEWRQPTPLPQAPPAVLGVVSVQGRMLTVLDPAILLEEPADGNSTTNLIVALRGDEQLALLVDEKGETVPTELGLQSAATNGAMLGFIKHQENEIGVLDLTKLFGLAIRGRERRQRRF